MTSPNQLSIYNGALRMLGQTRLQSLTEQREARFDMDEVWDENGLKACLEMGLWNFAMKTVKGLFNPSIEPPFGFRYVFDKPSDWVRTAAVASDEFFTNPLFAHVDEIDWYANEPTVYFKYVSDDASYGLDYDNWPESFRKFVHGYFANEIKTKLLKTEKLIETFDKEFRKHLTTAKSRDAMNQPSRFPAQGTWTRSRRGGVRERGNNSRLIG